MTNDVEAAQAALDAERSKLADARARKPPPTSAINEALSTPDAGELKGYARILAQIMSTDPEEQRQGRFAAADDVRRNLHRFKRRLLPSYPVRLPPESVLMGILRKTGKKRGHTDRRTVEHFVKWRDAVSKAEHANEATLRALFEAVLSFRELELPAYTVEILEHLAVEFDVDHVHGQRQEWGLERRTRDLATLSANLRRGSYEAKRKATEHPEDDATALHGGPIPAPGSDPDDAFEVGSFP